MLVEERAALSLPLVVWAAPAFHQAFLELATQGVSAFASSEDVQNERGVAERLIRSVAAELDVPLSVSYSNWPSGPKQEKNETTARPATNNGEGGLLLCPYFWEHQDSKAEPDYCEHILNPGQYDLVINILWSRLGIRSAPMFVMP